MIQKTTTQQKRIGLAKFIEYMNLQRRVDKDNHFMKNDSLIDQLFNRTDKLNAFAEDLHQTKVNRTEFHKLAISVQNHRAF